MSFISLYTAYMSTESQSEPGENDGDTIYTAEDVVECIERLADGNTPPTAEEFANHPNTMSLAVVNDKFGGWNMAVDTAGFTPRPARQRPAEYSERELVEQIQSLAEGEKPPTKNMFADSDETASPEAVKTRFGSWNKGIKAAGYQPNRRSPTDEDEDEVIEKIQNLSENGNPPTAGEFNQHDGPSSSVADRVFGSWDDAVKAAGFEPNKRGNDPISQDKIVDHVLRLTTDGELPTIEEFNEDEEAPSVATVRNRVSGGWSKVCEIAEQRLNNTTN